jgi:trigger factor
MEVHVESTGALTRRLHVKLPASQLEAETDARLTRMAGRAKVPGFRPGKVPMKVIRQQYGENARADAIGELVRQTYPKALEQAGVTPAGQPMIEIAPTSETEFAYSADFDVMPEVKLDRLGELRVRRMTAEVTEADIDRLVDNLRRAARQWEPVERAAAEGDQCVIDFEGTIGGEPFEGNRAADLEVELGSGNLLPDLEKVLVGRAPGEAFEADVHFPDDYRAEELRGKTAHFTGKVKAVRAGQLPELDDAAFLAQHGIEGTEGIDGLRAKARTALTTERDRVVRLRQREQVMEQLLELHPLEVPPSQVAGEIERLREETAGRMNMGRVAPEKAAELLPDALFESRARQRVALGLLIGEVIRVREIKLDQAAVETRLADIARDYERPEEVIQYYRSQPQVMNNLAGAVLEEQVVDALLADVEVTEESVSLDELLRRTPDAGGAGENEDA